MDDVERHARRLHHHHVGALREIEGDLPDRLVAIGGIHLVGLLVGGAERRRAPNGIAEGAVEGGGILRRIGQDADLLPAGAVEGPTDRPHAAVHHVGRGHDLAARLGEHHRLAAEHLDRLVVENPAFAEQAVVTVAGVGVERHVADDAHRVAELPPDRPHGAADEIVGIGRMGGVLRLEPRLHHWKQCDGRNSQLPGLVGRLHHAIDRQPFHARQARHGQTRLVVMDKERPDQVSRRERRFADHPPEPGMLPVPPETGRRKGCRGCHGLGHSLVRHFQRSSIVAVVNQHSRCERQAEPACVTGQGGHGT